MAVRQIVHIDEDKCNGCGLCVPNCAEGAIQIIDGKAKLLAENLCDGLGACLGHCPLDAIWVEERDADEFDEIAVEKHLGKKEEKNERHEKEKFEKEKFENHEKQEVKTDVKAAAPVCSGGGCPGSRAMSIKRDNKPEAANEVKPSAISNYEAGDIEVKIKPQLQQWPVQLMLVPPNAEYFQNADLLITADCVPFAYPNFHLDILKGKKLVVGCPKLDDTEFYVEKLTNILMSNNIKSLTVAYMEVPCCGGIVRAAQKALANSGKDIPLQLIKITIDGTMQKIS